MHANAAVALIDYLNPGAKVLDVGCGSGYLTAVLIIMATLTVRSCLGLSNPMEKSLGSNISLKYRQ